MKLSKLLEIWNKFLIESLEEDGFSGNGPLAEPADVGEEEEILDEEEDFQDKVKDGYVKKRNKYLKSGPQSPGSAYPKKTKNTRAKSAPPGFGGA
tara:strand:+ start:192 stop:476 length:285 start_codon:yes stop_codon:yes gene_type:complete